MITCDAPCSPPTLPTRSNLSGVHLPSSLCLLPPPPLHPPLIPLLPSVNIASNFTELNNFSGRKSSDSRGYPKDASLPDDLYPDDSQEQLIRSLIEEVLCEDNYHRNLNSEFDRIYVEPPNARSSLTSYVCAKQDFTAQDMYQPYGKTEVQFSLERVSPIPSPPTTKLNKVPNDVNKDSVPGMRLSKDCCSSEWAANREINFGSNKVAEDFNQKSCSCNAEEFNVELKLVNSSLSADISQLKVLVENLIHQVQDISDKLSFQKKLSTPVLDHSLEFDLMLEEYKMHSHVDKTAKDELFCKSEDKWQKPNESLASIFDWGAIQVDQSIIFTTATDYKPLRIIPPPPDLNQPTSQQSAVSKAENVVPSKLAKGYILGKGTVGKAKSFYKKHRIASTDAAKVVSSDQKIGLSSKSSTGASAVNGKVKEVDQQFQLSKKTKSAISVAEHKVNSSGSPILKNKCIFTGVSFVSAAFNKVGRTATDVGSKMKAKVMADQMKKRIFG